MRARYRGLVRVQVQKLMEGTAHNLHRMLQLLEGKTGFAINESRRSSPRHHCHQWRLQMSNGLA